MDGLSILFLTLAFVAGLAFGAMGYRYLLKRDPAKLEEMAKKAKELGDKAKARF
jgi:hypothetical protein